MSDYVQVRITFPFCATPYGTYRKFGQALGRATQVYGTLLEYAHEAFFKGENNTPPLSYREIGLNINMSRDTVQQNIAILEKFGVIRVIERFETGAGRVGNSYELFPPEHWNIPENTPVLQETVDENGKNTLGGKKTQGGKKPGRPRKNNPLPGGEKNLDVPYIDQEDRSQKDNANALSAASHATHAPAATAVSQESVANGSTTTTTRKKKEPFPADSDAVKLALWFRDKIVKTHPDAIAPEGDWQSKDIQKWAQQFAVMLKKLDKIKICQAIDNAYKDSWWRDKIMSPHDLSKNDYSNYNRCLVLEPSSAKPTGPIARYEPPRKTFTYYEDALNEGSGTR